MFWQAGFVCLLSIRCGLALQVPFETDSSKLFDVFAGTQNSDLARWRLDEPPDANATDRFIFETVASLLQHWPNTRYRNGHSIVPGTIPYGTLLYHGTLEKELPKVPEWTSTDPEHSIIFCRGASDTGCWHFTLTTTRPLKVLYFDGSSAAKTEYGTMDTQDLVAWGEMKPEWMYDERRRIDALCKWGEGHALDGFVRMEPDFEVMLCNFSSGVEISSSLNLANPRLPADSPPGVPHGDDIMLRAFELIHAGSWHNRYPGESRISLDLSHLVSFYDVDLVPSLVPVRAGLERWDHRVSGISDTDIRRVTARLAEVLRRPQPDASGVDWSTLIRVVVKRYAPRLELMRHLLDILDPDQTTILDRAKKVQIQLRVMLTPYIIHTIAPLNSSASNPWASSAFRECATAHTSSIASRMEKLSSSERVLLQAVQGTTREICRVTTNMWALGVRSGLDPYLPSSSSSPASLPALVDTWRESLSDLMTWLDWSVWVKCSPACGPEEMCYLPTWPIGFPNGPFPYPGREDEWKRPQPKCIRSVEPYGF
ncbi:hypothetical protein BV22DRAFT_1037011 [Leucogyrophana mollusca]|uniref:Uncharacterized protein n=1 Tax=Leucogyrophana mollusca TaxID=85980 RepID=A0ACB8BB15_9AGAM|nr:hypothetical protein BV22DRAFT_1037011 [Leucogyrophana mollusca]